MTARGLAIVLVSGGIDSAVALAWTVAEGYEARALTFDVEARAEAEVRAARAVAGRAGVPLEVVAAPFLREVADLGLDATHPLAGARGTIPAAYVPGRNLVFYGIAAARAEALGARAIVGGHIATDPDGFPDCAPAFFRALEALLAAHTFGGRARPVSILTPLAGLTKAEVLRRAIALGVPLGETFSCYGIDARPCGACPSCEERAEAFAAVGVADPTQAKR
jgi:7-cyano-7-deazaguanine synthase